jgi:hypothetical protein
MHHFKPNDTVYCRFTGEIFTVVSCDGVMAHLHDGTGRIVGELTSVTPRKLRQADRRLTFHHTFAAVS